MFVVVVVLVVVVVVTSTDRGNHSWIAAIRSRTDRGADRRLVPRVYPNANLPVQSSDAARCRMRVLMQLLRPLPLSAGPLLLHVTMTGRGNRPSSDASRLLLVQTCLVPLAMSFGFPA